MKQKGKENESMVIKDENVQNYLLFRGRLPTNLVFYYLKT